jgi:hypothetical protein
LFESEQKVAEQAASPEEEHRLVEQVEHKLEKAGQLHPLRATGDTKYGAVPNIVVIPETAYTINVPALN